MAALKIANIDIQPRKFNYANGGIREHNKQPRLYVHPEGETVLENLFVGRRARPHDLYRAEVLPQMKEKIAEYIANDKRGSVIDPADVSFSWSQRAGCSCGCSPGFVVKLPGVYRDMYSPVKFDVYVTVRALNDAATVTPDAKPDLKRLRKELQEKVDTAPSATQTLMTGRGPSGKLRNFNAMAPDKRAATVAAIFSEGNDPEAMNACWKWA